MPDSWMEIKATYCSILLEMLLVSLYIPQAAERLIRIEIALDQLDCVIFITIECDFVLRKP